MTFGSPASPIPSPRDLGPCPVMTGRDLYLTGVLWPYKEDEVLRAMAVDGVVPVLRSTTRDPESIYMSYHIRYPTPALAMKAHATRGTAADLDGEWCVSPYADGSPVMERLHSYVHERKIIPAQAANVAVPSADVLYDALRTYGPLAEVDVRDYAKLYEDETGWRAIVRFWLEEDAREFDKVWGRGTTFAGWQLISTVLDNSKHWPHCLRVRRGLSPPRSPSLDASWVVLPKSPPEEYVELPDD